MREHTFARVTPDALDDLTDRLSRTRAVPVPTLGRPLGVDPDLLAGLLAHWRDGFDWRAHEDRIAAHPWVETEETAVPVRAGDVGCDVAEALAARHPAMVTALHLTDVSQYHFLAGLPDDLDDEERAYVARGHRWQAEQGGYMHEQSTRPGTLAAALGDSPAGLAAWIVEKLVAWTDSDGDLSRAFTPDEALTWVSAYWFTGSIGTSFAPYAAGGAKDWPRIEAPTVFTVFAHDLVNAPRRFAERFFRVADWREHAHGGHFAAWERPDDYLWGLRRAVELRRRP